MDRRRFLGGAAALGGAAVVAVGVQPSRLTHAPRGPLYVLDETAFGILAAVAARTTGDDAADPVAIAHAADEALRFVSVEAQEELGMVLRLLESALAAVVLRGGARPYSALTPAEQDAALGAWLDSRLELVRGAGQALRKLTLGSYYAQLEAARQTGHPGPLFDKPDPGPPVARAALSPPFDPAAYPAVRTTTTSTTPTAPAHAPEAP